MVSVINIPQLKDNYSFAILNNKEVVIVDPADSIKILEYININQFTLKAILLTHHHEDHTAGVEGILNKIKYKIPVYSPNKKIKYTTKIVKDKEIINLNFIEMDIIKTPGHTLDHVIFYNKKYNLLFSGDTLFRLGCGRIFEGTNQEMFSSLKKIYKLDNRTLVYCGHEYTKTNLSFLLSIFPHETLLCEKKKIDLQIKETGSSIPFNLDKEKQLNPFLAPNSNFFQKYKKDNNLSNFEFFSYLRELKNNF